jgi:hypothetical protein
VWTGWNVRPMRGNFQAAAENTQWNNIDPMRLDVGRTHAVTLLPPMTSRFCPPFCSSRALVPPVPFFVCTFVLVGSAGFNRRVLSWLTGESRVLPSWLVDSTGMGCRPLLMLLAGRTSRPLLQDQARRRVPW